MPIQLNRRIPRFESIIDGLGRTIGAFDHGGNLTNHQVYIVEHALIELQIEWEHFVRNLILDSATGNYKNQNGVVSSISYPKMLAREKTGHFLLSLYPRRRTEPDWYLPNDAIVAATMLDISNLPNVSAQLGISPWVIDDLRYIRNFIAHRSKQSALKLRGIGFVTQAGRIDPVQSAYQHGASGAKNYIGWMQFMKFVANRLVQ